MGGLTHYKVRFALLEGWKAADELRYHGRIEPFPKGYWVLWVPAADGGGVPPYSDLLKKLIDEGRIKAPFDETEKAGPYSVWMYAEDIGVPQVVFRMWSSLVAEDGVHLTCRDMIKGFGEL